MELVAIKDVVISLLSSIAIVAIVVLFIQWLRSVYEARSKVIKSLNRRIAAHFGGSTERLEVVRGRFESWQSRTAAIAALDFVKKHEGVFLGIKGRYDMNDILEKAVYTWFEEDRYVSEDRPIIADIELCEGERHRALHDGLLLTQFEGQPVAMLLSIYLDDDSLFRVQIASESVELGRDLLASFRTFAQENSPLRGRLISWSTHQNTLQVLPHELVDWPKLVLPDETIGRIKRGVFEYAQYTQQLASNGMKVSRGVLLHGRPGTGKSLICSLLASQLTDFTTLLLSGGSLSLVRESLAVARWLSPALILFEDVDLVAAERYTNPVSDVLGDLLNEVDGLPSDMKMFFVFTTNRLEVIEEALAKRPGRVDLVLELPLPSLELRRKLLRLYAGSSHISDEVLEPFAQKSDGATPAFLCELMKEATFGALLEGSVNSEGIAKLESHHLRAANDQLLANDATSRRILGF